MSGRRAQSGFTLIEAVLALAIGAIVVAAAGSLVVTAVRAQAFARDISEATDAGTLAVERISMDLREMLAPPAAGLITMGASEVKFDAVSETGIHYRLDAAEKKLFRVRGTTAVLAHGVTGFTVRYLRADGTETVDPNLVRRIAFEIQVLRGDQTLRFGAQAFPRALSPTAPEWREP